MDDGKLKMENRPANTDKSELPSPNSHPQTPDARRQTLAAALQKCSQSIPQKAATAWKQFVETISQLEDETVRNSAAKMLRIVMDAGYDDYLKENFANYRNRPEDLEQLSVFAYQFGSVEDFLTQLALLTNVEAEDGDTANRDAEQIRLSTIHQAKGLEFDVVFVIMLCDGLFPSARSMENDEGGRRNAGCFTWPSRGRRTSFTFVTRWSAPVTAVAAWTPCRSRRVSCRKSRAIC